MDHDSTGGIETEEVTDHNGEGTDGQEESLYEPVDHEVSEYAIGDVEDQEELERRDGDYDESDNMQTDHPAIHVKETGSRRKRKTGTATATNKKQKKVVNDSDTTKDRSMIGQRPFQLKWLLQYEWLRYDPDCGRMFCTWCAEAQKKNAFGKPAGTNNFRKSNCDEHTKSRDHRDAVLQRQNGGCISTQSSDNDIDPTASVISPRESLDNTSISLGTLPVLNLVTPQNPDVRFHAKKAVMLLSGLLLNKNLPPSLAKDFLEIMPFMFPDSQIAAEVTKF